MAEQDQQDPQAQAEESTVKKCHAIMYYDEANNCFRLHGMVHKTEDCAIAGIDVLEGLKVVGPISFDFDFAGVDLNQLKSGMQFRIDNKHRWEHLFKSSAATEETAVEASA